MENLIRVIDIFSKAVGHAFAWCVLVLTASTCYEVFMRYVLNSPTVWAFDMSYMLYGALFMMSGAYALSRGSHVRGDFLYRKWAPRTQATVDLVLYIVFFFPGVTALCLSGWAYGVESFRISERSVYSPAGMPIWQIKMIIPAAGALLFLQGIAEVLRCIVCIRTGVWPERLHDVEEMETAILKQAQEHGLEIGSGHTTLSQEPSGARK